MEKTFGATLNTIAPAQPTHSLESIYVPISFSVRNLIFKTVLTNFKIIKSSCFTQKAVRTLCLRPESNLKYSLALVSSDVFNKSLLPTVTTVSAVIKYDCSSEDIASALSAAILLTYFLGLSFSF